MASANEEQGPRALSGEAAAAEEASAQARLLGAAAGSDPSFPASPRSPPATGWRARVRSVVDAFLLHAESVGSPRSPTTPPPAALVVADQSTEECPICLATLGSCVKTPCGHSFHAACLEHYVSVRVERRPACPRVHVILTADLARRCQFLTTPHSPGQRSRCPLCRSSVHAPQPVEVRAISGRAIEVTRVPSPGDRCHFDRACAPPPNKALPPVCADDSSPPDSAAGHLLAGAPSSNACVWVWADQFINLGDFDKPSMRYVFTSNEDRKTSNTQVMWVLDMSVPCTVHINFRSEHHGG